jgi:hypothetical protein
VIETDVLILGDSLGGCAAAMRLARMGVDCVLAEQRPWIGGQMTSQAVPPDEHPWIEEFGSTALYREFRSRVRQAYRGSGRLSAEAAADPALNPGRGWVSRLCCRPAIARDVIEEMVGSRLRRVRGRVSAVDFDGRRIRNVLLDTENGWIAIAPKIVLEATETGDLLLRLPEEHSVMGAESRSEHGEPHAPEEARPASVQPVTWVCALEVGEPGPPVERPASYDEWRSWTPPAWPGPLFGWKYPNVRTGAASELPLLGEFSWFTYRQVVAPEVEPGERPGTLVNWPQNDQMKGPSFGDEMRQRSRDLTLSFVHWLQTEAGHPEMRLAPGLTGTEDGLAQAPYIRESLRIRALSTLREQDVSAEAHPGAVRAPRIADSICIGAYRIDLHPRVDGAPTLDLSSLPYQIPLGCLIPREIRNLIPACKNIGVTHIANGCTRLHPVEWGIGEAAAVLAAWCLREGREVQEAASCTCEIQQIAIEQGLELDWPEGAPLRAL